MYRGAALNYISPNFDPAQWKGTPKTNAHAPCPKPKVSRDPGLSRCSRICNPQYCALLEVGRSGTNQSLSHSVWHFTPAVKAYWGHSPLGHFFEIAKRVLAGQWTSDKTASEAWVSSKVPVACRGFPKLRGTVLGGS